MKKTLMTLAATLIAAGLLPAQPRGNDMVMDASSPGARIQETMYGIFLEDINFAADGGLYAELVKNRSFEYANALQGWKTWGNVTLREDGPFERCPHYVRLAYAGHPSVITGVQNEGYFGMGVREGAEYRFTVWARKQGKGEAGLGILLADPSSMGDVQQFTDEYVEITSAKWQKYEVVFTCPKTVEKAVLRVILWSEDPGVSVDIEHVSLFPTDTFNGDENGLRKDVAQALADLHPGILRFPGGCIVEGVNLDNRYQWKNTVGPVENRPINLNRWSYSQFERMFPDYWQSGGLGFFEYFRLAEEIGAEPVPIISCGMACQFLNDPQWDVNVPLEDLQTYIDDALDLIEFANGSVKSKWGKVRAEMGHPEPFGMKYLGVGNEQWGKDFLARFEPMVKAIRAKHPEIKIIGTSGPYLGGEWFDELWPEMRRMEIDLVDEHYYSSETFFERNANRYDNYPRTGPKVFAGEYAAHGADGKKFNHFNAALTEASFMTGLERNADVVVMSCYAPTFAHVEGWQWRPDLIWFDNLRVMRSASYWVQQMYSSHRGTRVLPLTMDGKAVSGREGQNNLSASAVWDETTGDYIVKVANLGNYAQVVNLHLKGLPSPVTACERTVFHSDNPMEENTLDEPERIVPRTSDVDITPVAEPQNPWIMGMRTDAEGCPHYSERLGGRTFVIYRFKTK
ncbi:MAG: carbohydrate binding domain-containing protein [Bacteroidales bacterium]|nr:carbohydrate binding domain-containing protein [Bacteroidales bacterium]